jgi:hypothetical protein
VVVEPQDTLLIMPMRPVVALAVEAVVDTIMVVLEGHQDLVWELVVDLLLTTGLLLWAHQAMAQPMVPLVIIQVAAVPDAGHIV